VILNPRYAAASSASESEKLHLAGSRTAISGLRYYSPSLGRFVCRDPKEEMGGINLYAFIRNNAINGWDYLGMTGAGTGGFFGCGWSLGQELSQWSAWNDAIRDAAEKEKADKAARSEAAMAVVNAQWNNVVASVMPTLTNSMIQSTTNRIIATAQGVLDSAGNRMISSYDRAINQADGALAQTIAAPNNSVALINTHVGENSWTSTTAGGPPVTWGSTGYDPLDHVGVKASVDVVIPVPDLLGPRLPASNRVSQWVPVGFHFDVTASRDGLEAELKFGVGTPTSITNASGVGASAGLNYRFVGNYMTDTNWAFSASGGNFYGGSVEAGFDGTNLKTLDGSVGVGVGLGATVTTSLVGKTWRWEP